MAPLACCLLQRIMLKMRLDPGNWVYKSIVWGLPIFAVTYGVSFTLLMHYFCFYLPFSSIAPWPWQSHAATCNNLPPNYLFMGNLRKRGDFQKLLYLCKIMSASFSTKKKEHLKVYGYPKIQGPYVEFPGLTKTLCVILGASLNLFILVFLVLMMGRRFVWEPAVRRYTPHDQISILKRIQWSLQ